MEKPKISGHDAEHRRHCLLKSSPAPALRHRPLFLGDDRVTKISIFIHSLSSQETRPRNDISRFSSRSSFIFVSSRNPVFRFLLVPLILFIFFLFIFTHSPLSSVTSLGVLFALPGSPNNSLLTVGTAAKGTRDRRCRQFEREEKL